jgi:hypothetical protein
MPFSAFRFRLALPEFAATVGLPADVFHAWPTAPDRSVDSEAVG